MKQYTITVFSDESEDFEMQIIAHENILFSNLHQAIQTALEYDPLQMASFFLSNEDWEKNEEIALIDMEDMGNIALMDDFKLSSKIKNKDQKLLYLFDFFSERSFFINIDKITDTKEKAFSIDVKGKIPMQINIDNEEIDDLMQNIGGNAKESGLDEFEDDNISFDNIDDLEDF